MTYEQALQHVQDKGRGFADMVLKGDLSDDDVEPLMWGVVAECRAAGSREEGELFLKGMDAYTNRGTFMAGAGA